MGVSSIDVDAARDVVRRLRAFVEDAGQQWREVGRVSEEALCDTSALRGLFEPVMTVSDLASQLEERIELAVLIEAAAVAGLAGVVASGGVVTFGTLGEDDSIEDVRAQSVAVRMVLQVEALEPGTRTLGRADVETLGDLTAALEANADDPKVMAAFFDALGPAGTLDLPVMLRRFAAQYEAAPVGMSQDDLWWDQDTRMSGRVVDLQQRFIEAYGAGLGLATRSEAFAAAHPRFGTEVAALVTAEHTGHGWSFAQILGHGTFSSVFLNQAAAGILDAEVSVGGISWVSQNGGEVLSWRLGTTSAGVDPLAAALTAMSRTPGALSAFLVPGDPREPGTVERATARRRYLLGEREWTTTDTTLERAMRLAVPQAAASWWQAQPLDARTALLADHPDYLGALEGIPTGVRDTANRSLLAGDLADVRAQIAALDAVLAGQSPQGGAASAQQPTLRELRSLRERLAMLEAVDAQLTSSADPPRSLLVFDGTMPGHAAIAIGDLDTADHVAVLVPGMGSHVTNYMGYITANAERVTLTAGRAADYSGDPSTVAAVAWVGYTAPDLDVVATARASAGVPLLQDALWGIQAAHGTQDPHLTVLGHSYGSLLSGMTMTRPTPVDDLMLFGSPGAGVEHASELDVPTGHVFVGEAHGDAVADLERFGGDPAQVGFGATTFQTDGGTHPLGGGDTLGSTGHSQYYDENSESLWNIAAVVAGHPESLTTGFTPGAGDVARWYLRQRTGL